MKIKRTKEKREALTRDQIKRINYYREKNDIASILKEFKKITRKPFVQIKELKNKDGVCVVNPKHILNEIENNIKKTCQKMRTLNQVLMTLYTKTTSGKKQKKTISFLKVSRAKSMNRQKKGKNQNYGTTLQGKIINTLTPSLRISQKMKS